MSGRLQHIADLAVTACIVVVAMATVFTILRHRHHESALQALTVRPGEKLVIPNVEWGKYDKSIVLAVRNSCHFCTESMPFYGRLLGSVKLEKNIQILAVAPDPPAVTKQYLSSHQIELPTIEEYSFATLKIAATPTLLIVSRDGRVEKIWVGRLNTATECEVFKSLDKQCEYPSVNQTSQPSASTRWPSAFLGSRAIFPVARTETNTHR